MKKAVALSFLLQIIIGLAFLFTAVTFGKELLQFPDKTDESFKVLTEMIKKIQDRSRNSMTFSFGDDVLLAGFSKDADFIKTMDNRRLGGTLQRPSSCPKGKACFCKCENYEIGENIICKEQFLCSSFDTIDFFDPRPLHDLPYTPGQEDEDFRKRYWAGGFLFLYPADTSKKVRAVYALENPNYGLKNPAALYVERYESHVAVCASPTCITDTMKDRLRKQDAIESFNLIQSQINSCKDKEGYCNTLNFFMPERYYLVYRKANVALSFLGIDESGISLTYNPKGDEQAVIDDTSSYAVKKEDETPYFTSITLFEEAQEDIEDPFILDDFSTYELWNGEGNVILKEIS